QALIRVAFVSFITLYLLLNRSAYEPVALCLIYLCFGILMLINILRHPQKNEKRQWTALVMDLTATSLEQMISGPMAGIFVGIYLWLIMGYGLRYGTKFFKGCYALGVIGFSATLYLNPYWSNHQHLAYGFLLTLILIPLHTMRLQINLENAIRQADLANRAKTNFLSNISHEIRTPLNGIIGASELLAQTTLDSKQKQLLEMAGTSASTLKKLINDVLDINKIEKGKIELETQSFFLPDMLQRLNQICQPEIERKRLWLRIHIDPSAQRYFSGSLQHIEQVLMNLLANAIKFTQHGGVHVYVNTTQQFAAMSMVRFRILDTGIGIKADALPHIFDSFTQADSSISKRYGGTGLGTTIAKQLVELMAGEISVFSEEGAGTTFEVLLPLQHSEAMREAEMNDLDLSQVSNVVPLSSHNKFRKKIRVLIADDNAVNRMILSEILQSQHCIVKAVDSGDAALDVLEHQQFDLMILDYNMPVMNGLEVFTLYHALPGSRPLKTVILTADATPATQERCLQAGILRVLTKPVISKQIRMLIEEVAQLKQKESKTSKPARTGRQTGKVTTAVEAVTAEFPGSAKVAKLTPSNEPCLDQARLEHLVKLGGGEAFVFRLITEFIENTDDIIRMLGAQCRDLNFDQVSKLAHNLAGESANMGLIPLSKASRRLLKLTMEDAQIISGLYQAVVEVYDDTRLQLQQHRSKLSSKRSHK
ncbi:MAG TPA: ATP-binding protein, partial [Methylophilus sp.]